LIGVFLLLFHIQVSTKFDVSSIFKTNTPLAKFDEVWNHTVIVEVSTGKTYRCQTCRFLSEKESKLQKTGISLHCSEQVLKICAAQLKIK
jgi:hypothetical protein